MLSNAEIADRLASLGQLLSMQKENPYKARAYRRAATKIRTLPDSVEEMVREDADLTKFAGIGEAIASAIREIVLTGELGKLEALRAEATPAVASLSEFPRLDPKRVLRVYKKLGIATVEELRERLESGEIERVMGLRTAQHVRQGITETRAMLLYRADDLRAAVEEYLVTRCGVKRAAVTGDYRRRVEVVEELVFVVLTDDFPAVVERLQRYGGRTPLQGSRNDQAVFALSSGVLLRIQLATESDWGTRMVVCTGSGAHVQKLGTLREFPNEEALYGALGMQFVEPELREGTDELARAASGRLPRLVTVGDLRGELHAHSTSSDGGDSIEAMAEAARARGYEYLGITDHSQSLKIARGVSIEDLRAQIRYIDQLNGRLNGFRVLKSSEVDILADGTLDYPDELLRELDYTVCSIHSRFSLGKQEQTERILRAMDNPYFRILGHAIGRLLLTRPGYEIDVERVIEQARQNGRYFEINSSPNRLDLPAEHVRRAAEAGVKIAINTDAHGVGEYALVRCGIDQARRAGLEASMVLNCQPLERLVALFRR